MRKGCSSCRTFKPDVKICYAVTYSGMIRKVHLCTECKTRHENRLRRCTFCGKHTVRSFWRVFGWPNQLEIAQVHCCQNHLDPKYHNGGLGGYDTEAEARIFIITETLTGNNNEHQ